MYEIINWLILNFIRFTWELLQLFMDGRLVFFSLKKTVIIIYYIYKLLEHMDIITKIQVVTPNKWSAMHTTICRSWLSQH